MPSHSDLPGRRMITWLNFVMLLSLKNMVGAPAACYARRVRVGDSCFEGIIARKPAARRKRLSRAPLWAASRVLPSGFGVCMDARALRDVPLDEVKGADGRESGGGAWNMQSQVLWAGGGLKISGRFDRDCVSADGRGFCCLLPALLRWFADCLLRPHPRRWRLCRRAA